MSLDIVTLTDAIAALSVTITERSGTVKTLTIRAMDDIPMRVFGRDCPILYPDPVQFVTEFNPVKATLGEGINNSWDVGYRIHYTLLYSSFNAGRGMENFSGAVVMAFAVMQAVMTANPIAGAVLLRPDGIDETGILYDAAGAQAEDAEPYYGLSMSFTVFDMIG